MSKRHECYELMTLREEMSETGRCHRGTSEWAEATYLTRYTYPRIMRRG